MTDSPKTKEEQYGVVFQVRDRHGISRLGLMVNESWNQDPRRTLFMLARYKFVAKLLTGRKRVLEVGCADAFGTRLVQQTAGKVTAVDFDPVFIDDARARADPHWPLETFVHDMLAGPVESGGFDAAFALDVLEHIQPADERRFLDNFCASLSSACHRSNRRPMPPRPAGPATSTARRARTSSGWWRSISTPCSSSR